MSDSAAAAAVVVDVAAAAIEQTPSGTQTGSVDRGWVVGERLESTSLELRSEAYMEVVDAGVCCQG